VNVNVVCTCKDTSIRICMRKRIYVSTNISGLVYWFSLYLNFYLSKHKHVYMHVCSICTGVKHANMYIYMHIYKRIAFICVFV
jgi:hypothetical protein